MAEKVLFDFFCGEGGASTGYNRGGYQRIVGVDLNPMDRYPFEIVKGDAIDVLERLLAGERIAGYALEDIHAFHGSPPCQEYSKALRHLTGPNVYPKLIDPIRALFQRTGKHYVIENVPGSPIPHQETLFGVYGLELCGTMFHIRIRRHRLFETSFFLRPPRGCDHTVSVLDPYGTTGRERFYRETGQRTAAESTWRREMGVDWMTGLAAREAIPPVYTKYIGQALIALP